MEYGILVSVAEDGSFQIVGAVGSREEANEMADSYMLRGASNDWLAPWEFQIHKRGNFGGYTVIDHLRFV